jgi:colicin import membrane protein
MTEKRSDKWVSLTLSVLVHGTIVGLLVWGFVFYKREKSPEPQLAIQATVVDSRTLPAETFKAVPAAPAPVPVTPPEPPPPEAKSEPKEEPPPPPPDDTVRKEQERKDQQRKEQERKAEEQRVAVERERAEKQRVEKEHERQEAERVAKEKTERDKAEKERQEKVRVEKEKADQLAQQRAAEEKLKAQRESELRAQVAAEERVNAARNSGLMQQYLAQIRGKIERTWIRPPSARSGLACDVRITQTQGGEVVAVQVGTCNGDDAVRQSIEAAAYKASPLPAAPDPALFDRNLVVTFRPEGDR